MRIDLTDLDRLEGIAEALGRLFWCLVAVAFFAAILGSAGTGLLVLILGGASFCARVGFEDFVRSRRGSEERPTKRDDKPSKPRRAPKVREQPSPSQSSPSTDPVVDVYRYGPRRRKGRSRKAA
jgi:hypothetical protein